MEEEKKKVKKKPPPKPKPWYLGFGFLRAAAEKLKQQRDQTDAQLAKQKKE